jgi:hypothetical protein
VHVLAWFYHQFVQKDGLFRRMCFGRRVSIGSDRIVPSKQLNPPSALSDTSSMVDFPECPLPVDLGHLQEGRFIGARLFERAGLRQSFPGGCREFGFARRSSDPPGKEPLCSLCQVHSCG